MMTLSVRFVARDDDGKEFVREGVDLDHDKLGHKPLSTPLVMLRKYAPGM